MHAHAEGVGRGDQGAGDAVTAVNPMRGEAALVTDAGTYLLVLDVNAFCIVEQALDMPLRNITDNIEKNASSMSEIRALLWAALSRRHPGTIAEAGDIMSSAGLKATRQALVDALLAAFGVAKEGGESVDPPKPPEDGTG